MLRITIRAAIKIKTKIDSKKFDINKLLSLIKFFRKY